MRTQTAETTAEFDADVVLIGAGIMSATLGAMLAQRAPGMRVLILERASEAATESSGTWNNAGTGHSGFCELNYMPDPTDGATAIRVAEQFSMSERWWSQLSRETGRSLDRYIRPTPHLNVVFGDRDVAYLRRRYQTLSGHRLFAAMEYTEDPAQVARWVPPVMDGRDRGVAMAATRHPGGTDIDFGGLTRELIDLTVAAGGTVRYGHHVRKLRRTLAGWSITGRNSQGRFTVQSRRVFVGAGGNALRLLQSARIPQVRGYAVLPVGAAFYRCSHPEVARLLDGKVYGQAEIGAPPMSVPHLDRRSVDGADHLLFGPFATFSTKLLKQGSRTDFFATVRVRNAPVIAGALLRNLPLMKYLITELLARDRTKFGKLQRYFPGANRADFELIPAGQRAQLVVADRSRIGALQQGTELVVGGGGTISGLLGASPGASTAVPIMDGLLRHWLPES